jgi:hypothetical protein
MCYAATVAECGGPDRRTMIPLEQEIEKAETSSAGAKAWLKDNRDVVQPSIDAAKKAQ